MSKKYTTPTLEVAHFTPVRVITTSPTIQNGPSDPSKPNLGRDRWDDDDDDF